MENQEEEVVQSVAVEEDSVTFEDIVKEMDEAEKQAELLFGAQDSTVCTYPEGYKPRQTVFTCLTCTPAPLMAGVCYGCSLHCHEGHDVVELYTKRKFRCDCGNSKFESKKCQLYESKDAQNQYNMYNHNYNAKFCVCDIYYPEDSGDHEFLQCEICEDWYHNNHLNIKQVFLEEPTTNSEHGKELNSSIVCSSCVKNLPFVQQIPHGKERFCHFKLTSEQLKLSEESISVEIQKFRERLCKCTGCVSVYERANCDFLLDDEDDIGTFEMESKKKAEENKQNDNEEMRELVKEIGMEGAQRFYSGVNEFKRKLGDFMNKAGENGKAISEDDVKTFFSALNNDQMERKRARFEENN